MDSDYKVMDLDTIEREIRNGKKSRQIRRWEKDFIGGLHLLYLASVECWIMWSNWSLLCDILAKLSKFSIWIWQLFIFQNCPGWKFCHFEWRSLPFCEFAQFCKRSQITNLFVTLKTNFPIHEFKVLQNVFKIKNQGLKCFLK